MVVATKKRVLVADDEPAVLRFVDIALARAGYEVTTTTSGEEAIDLVQAKEPDIILLDVLMVPMSGFDVLEKVRTFSQVPIVVFTARSFIADQAMKFGANGFIAKPFRPEQLVETIQAILNEQAPDDGKER